jgi:hypothetical protein
MLARLTGQGPLYEYLDSMKITNNTFLSLKTIIWATIFYRITDRAFLNSTIERLIQGTLSRGRANIISGRDHSKHHGRADNAVKFVASMGVLFPVYIVLPTSVLYHN